MDVWCVCMHAASTYTLGVLSHAKSSGTWAPRLSELWDLSAFPSWETVASCSQSRFGSCGFHGLASTSTVAP